MDSFNKVISFVLGLVVVLVFFAVVTGKINFKSKTTSVSSATPTPTQTQKNDGGFFGFLKSSPSSTPTPTPTVTNIPLSTTKNNVYKAVPKSIPSAGLPTLFIPLLLSALVGGNFLRSAKPRDL